MSYRRLRHLLTAGLVVVVLVTGFRHWQDYEGKRRAQRVITALSLPPVPTPCEVQHAVLFQRKTASSAVLHLTAPREVLFPYLDQIDVWEMKHRTRFDKITRHEGRAVSELILVVEWRHPPASNATLP